MRGQGGDRADEAGLVIGAAVCLVVGVVAYPPPVLGGVLGACLGVEVARRRSRHRRADCGLGWWVVGAGLVLAAICGLGESVGMGEERMLFLKAWSGDGLGGLDVSAFWQYPWAWVPPSSSIGAVVAGLVMVFRG